MRTLAMIGGVYFLLEDVAVWLALGLFSSKVRLGRAAVVTQMVRIGVRSVGIVMLVNGCIGFILALNMARPLDDFGQVDQIATIVAIAIFRELGPLVSAVVLTGFAGAAIAAEIGTMVVGEEIEALEAHALDPIRFLVVPRLLAASSSLFLLTIIGDVTGVLAGGVTSVMVLGVPYEVYKDNTIAAVDISDFATGLAKAAVFGVLLSGIACHNGLKVTGGAAGVGRATTDTVVQTVVAVIIADLAFTAVFYAVGWT